MPVKVQIHEVKIVYVRMYHLTLTMTSAQVVNVITCTDSPQDYTHPDVHTSPTYDDSNHLQCKVEVATVSKSVLECL